MACRNYAGSTKRFLRAHTYAVFRIVYLTYLVVTVRMGMGLPFEWNQDVGYRIIF